MPTKVYPGAHGTTVGFYTGLSIAGSGPLNYLAFQFGRWVVLVDDYPSNLAGGFTFTDQERATWAASLTGHETSDGFLVLDPTPPLQLAYTDLPDGQLGDFAAGIIFRSCGARPPHTSGLVITHYPGGVSLCLPEHQLVILLAAGQPAAAARQFSVRRVRRGRLAPVVCTGSGCR